ncbi:MAG: hypothetical protein HY706_17305 [Candidatus Hydrogenedentes bacterium]|nr:hypothetical protein [Candidatus Hydrogenedentota bacterium]
MTIPRRKSGWPIAAFSLTGIALLLGLFPNAPRQLAYEPNACGLIPLLSCHWTHWSYDHLLWSSGTFGVLAVMCERFNRKQFLVCLAFSIPLIPWAATRFTSSPVAYAGLSGLDSALFALLGVQVAVRTVRSNAWGWFACCTIFPILFTAKLAYESVAHQTVFVAPSADFIPVPTAHLFGALIGFATGVLFPRASDLKQTAYGWRGPTRST